MLPAKSGCVTGKAFALQIRPGGLELGPITSLPGGGRRTRLENIDVIGSGESGISLSWEERDNFKST